MSPLAFDHIAIPVADAAAARKLFGTVLGLPLIAAYSGEEWSGSPWLMMIYGLEGGGQIALCALAGKRPGPKPAEDLPHYAFAVRNQGTLAKWRRKLADAGYAVRDEDHGRQRSIYFEDDGGTTWEITAPPSRNEASRDANDVVARWLEAHGARAGRAVPSDR